MNMKCSACVAYGMLVLCSVLFSRSNLNANDPGQKVEAVVDRTTFTYNEWKNPGKYCPVNLFDNDPDTFSAEETTFLLFGTEIKFNKKINIDEIRVTSYSGTGKNTYHAFNRVRLMYIDYYTKSGADPVTFTYTLEDTAKAQRIKLDKVYTVESVGVGCYSTKDNCVYIGKEKYVTAMADVSLYYKGEKVVITNIEKLKTEYRQRIANDLSTIFSDRKYRIHLDKDSMYCYKNGNIEYVDNVVRKNVPPTKSYLPSRWKVKDARLYMLYRGKWELFKYTLSKNDNNYDLRLIVMCPWGKDQLDMHYYEDIK